MTILTLVGYCLVHWQKVEAEAISLVTVGGGAGVDHHQNDFRDETRSAPPPGRQPEEQVDGNETTGGTVQVWVEGPSSFRGISALSPVKAAGPQAPWICLCCLYAIPMFAARTSAFAAVKLFVKQTAFVGVSMATMDWTLPSPGRPDATATRAMCVGS